MCAVSVLFAHKTFLLLTYTVIFIILNTDMISQCSWNYKCISSFTCTVLYSNKATISRMPAYCIKISTAVFIHWYIDIFIYNILHIYCTDILPNICAKLYVMFWFNLIAFHELNWRTFTHIFDLNIIFVSPDFKSL